MFDLKLSLEDMVLIVTRREIENEPSHPFEMFYRWIKERDTLYAPVFLFGFILSLSHSSWLGACWSLFQPHNYTKLYGVIDILFLLSIGQAPKRMSESWMCWFTDCITSNLTMAKKNGECYVKGGIDLDEKTFCTQSNQSFGLLSPNQTRVSLLFHVCGVCVSSFAFAKFRFAYWYVYALQFTIVHFDIWCDNDTIYNGTKWHFGCIRMPSCTYSLPVHALQRMLSACVCVCLRFDLSYSCLLGILAVCCYCLLCFVPFSLHSECRPSMLICLTMLGTNRKCLGHIQAMQKNEQQTNNNNNNRSN